MTEGVARSAFAPLRHRIFASVWFANIVSNIGSQVQIVGAGWLMVSLSASPQAVALIQTATSAPTMLFALVAGALADTHDRRIMMLIAQSALMAAALTLAGLAYGGWLTPTLLIALTFLMGTGAALHFPAWQSSVGEMVPQQDLRGAIALNSAGFNIARSAGPAVGGAVVTAGGAALAFAVNALSYAGLLIVLALWRAPKTSRLLPPEELAPAMISGVRYVARSPAISAVMLRSSLFGFAACSVLALLPVIVSNLLHGDAFTFGLLLGAFGIGAISTVPLGVALRHRYSDEVVVRGSISLLAAATLVIALSPALALSACALVIAGSGWAMTITTFNTAVQVSAPRWVVARSLALYHTASAGGIAAGSFVWGTVADGYGIRTALAVSACTLLIAIAVGFRHGLKTCQKGDLDPAREYDAPQTSVPMEGGHGPVIVFVEYQVPRANIRRFKSLMAQRRRIRLRDGGRNWSLMRDLQSDEMWIEQYGVPTWNEYLRHKNRKTKADLLIAEAIRALLVEGSRPSVTRAVLRKVAGR